MNDLWNLPSKNTFDLSPSLSRAEIKFPCVNIDIIMVKYFAPVRSLEQKRFLKMIKPLPLNHFNSCCRAMKIPQVSEEQGVLKSITRRTYSGLQLLFHVSLH